MNESPESNNANPESPRLPWSLRDTWLGLGLLLLIQVIIIAAILIFKPPKSSIRDYAPWVIILNELVLIIPVILVLGWRQANWRLLGFREFGISAIGMGCGFLIAAFLLTIINNSIFLALGWQVQANQIIQLLKDLPSPAAFIFTAVILAPLVEESLFRGFLFAGFRQSYGWNKAALLSSGLFALAHVLPAAFIPTFILGYSFSYLYHKSDSLWPGILMHFLVNAFGVLALFAYLYSGHPIPS